MYICLVNKKRSTIKTSVLLSYIVILVNLSGQKVIFYITNVKPSENQTSKCKLLQYETQI